MAWGSGGFKSCDKLLDRVEQNDPKLVELVILPMKNFGEAEAGRLANILSTGKNSNLTSISASGHSIPPSALSQLGKALRSPGGRGIAHIAIGNEDMKDEGIEAFCQPLLEVNGNGTGTSSSLVSVDFAYKNITSVGAGIIGRAFGKSENIQRIDMYRNPAIGDEGMVAFSNYTTLESSKRQSLFPALEHLDFSECEVGSEGVKALVNCLTQERKVSKRLSSIDLQAGSNPIGPKGCKYLKELISHPLSNGKSSLKKLSLRKCSIGDEGFVQIVEGLKYCGKGFIALDVAGNGIGKGGAEALADSLKNNRTNLETLKELNLADNPIGDDGVVSLAASLKRPNQEDCNGTVESLDLTGTKCGIIGAVHLLKCSSLKSIRLFNNNLGSEGFEAITPLLLGGHPTLEHLDLGGNRAEESVVAALLSAVMIKNKPDDSVLRTIELGGNEVGDLVEQILKELETVRPDLDVVRDRPSVKQPNEFPDGEMKT